MTEACQWRHFGRSSVVSGEGSRCRRNRGSLEGEAEVVVGSDQ